MKKRILLSFVWSLGFATAGLLIWMIIFRGLGFFGVFSDDHKPGVRFFYPILVKVYFWSMCASPVIGLVLGIWGVLPGTRRQAKPATDRILSR